MPRPRTFALALFAASVAGLSVPSAAALQQGRVPTVEEPKTDVKFPVTRVAEDGKTTLALAGTALRDKRVLLNFKVYAYGLYIDAAKGPAALAKWKGKSAKRLKDDQNFYKALLKDDFAKSIRIIFVRDVDGEDVEEAFTDSIEPRVKKAHDKMKMKDATAAVRTFKGFFNVDELAEGDEIIFTWLPGGKLETTVKGKRKPTIESKALCWALFDIYLGDRPIESKGKGTMIERIPNLLK